MTIDRKPPGHGGERRGGPTDTSYTAFRAARERFMAHLRADSEVRRLEAALRLPPPGRPVRPRGDAG